MLHEETALQNILLIPGNPELSQKCQYSLKEHHESLKLSEDLEGAIPLCGFQQKIEHTLGGSAGGVSRATGRPKVGDLLCRKDVDGMTPILLEHCLNGEPLGLGGYTTQILVCNELEGQLQLVMGFRLSNALITQISTHIEDSRGRVMDEFYLNASMIQWFRPGVGSQDVVTGWDLISGKSLKF